MHLENIIVKKHSNGVGVIRLNRPKVLNALNSKLLEELAATLAAFEADDEIGAVVITGTEKAFAAGADVSELAGLNVGEVMKTFRSGDWDAVRSFGKPIIAAVSGLVLGGGFELVLQCDIVIAGDNCVFALPEIDLGVIPGAGGTQRIVGAVGKSMAMEMVLNGRKLSSEEAFSKGVVSRIVSFEVLMDEAIKLAGQLAARAPLTLRLAKDAVIQGVESKLEHGLVAERRNFFALFGTHDCKEGMQAFIDKREPLWKGC